MTEHASAVTRRGLLGAGAALAAGAALPSARADDGQPLVVYAVRHAEKQAGDDPALTEAGAARAAALASVLRDVPLTAVFSTDTKRTRATAEPTAAAKKVEVATYEPRALAKLLADRKGAVLVVGHSDTIPALVRELGGDAPQGELEGFDDLFVVVRLPGKPLVQRLHYGAPSGASASMR